MSHLHDIEITGTPFVIDPVTRKVTSEEVKKLIQYDHNSTRYAFQCPKVINGHDMSESTKIEVHYINIQEDKTKKNEDLYRVKDVTVDGDNITFSWLVSINATSLKGITGFIIRFSCLTDAVVDYAWHTELCMDEVQIGEGQYSSEYIADVYSDVLEEWRNEFIETYINSVSWNNLADRPFGDYTKTLTYDGNLADKECIEAETGVYYVKISDTGAETEDLIGGSVTFADGEEEVALTISEAELSVPTEGAIVYTYANLGLMLAIAVNADSVEMDGLTGSRGIYVLNIVNGDNSAWVKSFTYGRIEKIDPKYLPETDSCEIPEVTDEDEGKFLIVSNGVPTWVALTNVAEVGA